MILWCSLRPKSKRTRILQAVREFVENGDAFIAKMRKSTMVKRTFKNG